MCWGASAVLIEKDIWPDSLQVSAKVKKQTFGVSL